MDFGFDDVNNLSQSEKSKLESSVGKALEHFQRREFNLALPLIIESINLSNKFGISIPNLYLIKAYSEMQLGRYLDALNSINQECTKFPSNYQAFTLKQNIELELKKGFSNDYTESLVLNKQSYFQNHPGEFIASIIIPVFNKVELTKQCIKSIIENTPEFKELQLIIVDNASTDGTKEFLAQLSTSYKNIHVITNSQNLGFAKACNQGISASNSKYIVLLNNDTIVTQGWLSNLINEAESSKDIGIVGSKLLYPNSNLIQHIGVKFVKMDKFYPYHFAKLNNQKNIPEAHISMDYNCVTFACVLIKKEVFERIGLLDEDYINSYEDVDFCIRAREANFRIRFCANSVIYHFESQTPNRNKYDQMNLDLLNKKWSKILDKYSDNYKGFIELGEIWSREDLNKNPNNLISLHQLGTILHEMKRFEEFEIIKKEFEEKIALFKKTIPTISIIIPTHNNWDVTFQCIRKIFHTVHTFNYEIIIVDNNSVDSTVPMLKRLERIGLLKAIYNKIEKNYSESNNQGARIARGKYLVFLNNDVFLDNNWSEALLETFENNPKIGIQGAKLLYPNGLVQHAGIVFRRLKNGMKLHYHIYLCKPSNELCVSKSREVQAVTGAFLAIRRELFEAIGGFDETYQFGHEDIDLCIAVRRAGYKVWFNAKILAVHLESMTKKLKGLDYYALKFNDPNSIDLKNYLYFHKKWGDFIEVDDYRFYQEDNEYNPFIDK